MKDLLHGHSRLGIARESDALRLARIFAATLFFAAKKRRRRKRSRRMKDAIFQLCDQVRETSLALHGHLRHGHCEKVYENGLANRLRKLDVMAIQQHPLNVFDVDGTLLGAFFADLFVNQELIVELKAVRSLVDEHVAQLLGYLRASRIEHGLLINFGSPRLQIRKYVLSRL